MKLNEITEKIIGAAIEVHRVVGSGLLESTYEECLTKELELRGLNFERQKALPVVYKDLKLGCGYRLDFLVESQIIIELKSIDEIHPIHIAQVLTYLRLLEKQVGLLMNFNVPVLRDGIKRIVNNYKPD